MKTAEEMNTYCRDKGYGRGLSKKWSLKHFKLVEGSLSKNEEVYMCFIGLHNFKSTTKHDNNYAYAITGKRIIMAQKKMFGENIQTVSLDKINDVTLNSNLMMGIITFDSLKEVFNVGENKDVAKKIYGKVLDLINRLQVRPTNNFQSSSSQPSTADEILKLKNLLDMNIITEEEFTIKKRQLLGL